MPYLVDAPTAQGPRLLTRRFSWEEDYDQSEADPEVGKLTEALKVLNVVDSRKSIVEERTVANNGPLRPQISRKPVSFDRGSRSSFGSSGSEQTTSSLFSGNESTAASSRSSSVSPPPHPTSKPLSVRPSAPVLPLKLSLSHIHNINQPLPKSMSSKQEDVCPLPKQKTRASWSPKDMRLSKLPFFHSKDTKAIPATANPIYNSNRGAQQHDTQPYSRAPPIPPKVPFSPIKSQVMYTAMLDFSPAVQTPPARPFAKKPSTHGIQPTARFKDTSQKRASTQFSLPSPVRNDIGSQPKRYRQFSDSSPTVARKVSAAGPVISPLNTKPITGWFDTAYRGGYELADGVAADSRSSMYSQDDVLGMPSFQPPPSPKSTRPDKPPRPRISTDLASVEPLNFTSANHIRHEEISAALTSAEAQCAELTDILDLYLEEIVTDATARGVMSSHLRSYLRSTGDDDSEDDGGPSDLRMRLSVRPRDGIRSVSIVRRALRADIAQ